MDVGKFEYFIHQTNRRLDKIDGKLEQLIGFRWLLIGISLGVSAIISFVVNLIHIKSQ